MDLEKDGEAIINVSVCVSTLFLSVSAKILQHFAEMQVNESFKST